MPDPVVPRRRSADNHAHDIETMIAEENDPKQRATLIVLNAISQALAANTYAVTGIGEKLDRHLLDYDQHTQEEAAILNKRRGAWKVTAYVVAGLQTLILAVAGFLQNDLASIHEKLNDLAVTDARIVTRIDALEKKGTDHMAKENTWHTSQ